MTLRRLGVTVVLAAAVGMAGATTDPDPARTPATARWATHDALRHDLTASRHPADGGGRAWIETAPDVPPRAGGRGRWTIGYEAGPRGIAAGGALFLQVSPFWGWSTPQTVQPSLPGYTEVRTGAEGVILETETVDQQLLAIRVAGRALAEGERVFVTYGAGDAGAVVDRFAERDSRFWIAVDGDGDGVRKILADSPGTEIAAGPPARMIATIPSTGRTGEPLRLTVAILDRAGNAGPPVAGALAIEAPAGIEIPSTVTLDAADRGRVTVPFTATEEGIYRLRVTGPSDLAAETNPLLLRNEAPRILWGDLQIHTGLSDGTGRPEDVLRYARDVAALDVAALTDHDHWGFRFLDQSPEVWNAIRRATAELHEPGRFVTVLGYEWTNWVHGHRHVLYFDGEGEVLSSLDPRYDTPAELWAALAGRPALTIAHHSAGSPVPVNWAFAPDPALEPITEIVSVHGASEAADAPQVLARPVQGNFVRDQLDKGYRLGFVGSTDGHDGHPGLAHLAAPSGGVMAVLSEELSRDAVLAAIRARRVYATNGPRIILRLEVAGQPMGSVIPAAAGASDLVVRAVTPAPILHLDLIRSGAVIERIEGGGRRVLHHAGRLDDLRAGEYVYVRLVEDGRGAAWSSPIFVE